MAIFYAETGMGCCIREADNIETARAIILTEVGLYNGIHVLRKATASDIDWVFKKGGWIPSRLRAKKLLEKAYADSQAIGLSFASPKLGQRPADQETSSKTGTISRQIVTTG